MATPNSAGQVSDVSPTGQNYIDSLLSDYKWGGSVGTGASLTYSFRSNSSYYSNGTYEYGPTNGSGEPWKPGWVFLTDTQKTGIERALGAWAEVANITFTEVTDSSTVAGDLRFGTEPGISRSHAYYPWPSAKAGDVWLTTNSNLNTSVKGTYGYLTFLHEIGHALGLEHPHEGVVASSSIDALPFSVMSYRDYVGDANEIWDSGLLPTTPMLNDIAVIQHLYGANMATRSGNTIYSWAVGEQIYATIWDGGGNDTIDWSNQSSAATINLNAGQWSYIGPARWDGHVHTQQNLAIAYNVTIEDAIGGSRADLIIGNSASNTLSGGGGNDRLEGRAGHDRFDWEVSGRAGADTFVGGPGNDEYVISGDDQIVERDGEGTDTIWATVDFSIAAIPNVENLFLFGSEPVSATGNSIENEIRGNAANNAIDGDGGADTLMGGPGRDTLTGANGSDKLVGQGGDDVLRGGAGNDLLSGRGGSDRFDFNVALNANSNADTITDFSAANDVMCLDNDIFTAFATANVTLSASAFYAKAGITAAHDSTDRIIYNSTTGNLYYDADGTGNTASKLFATLANEAAITAADFFIIA